MHAEIYIYIRLHPFFDLDEEDDLIDGCDSPIDSFGDSPIFQQYAPVHPPYTYSQKKKTNTTRDSHGCVVFHF